MIGLTDEMRQAFADAAGWPPAPWMFGPDVERGITAVLALVERDYYVRARIPLRCGATGPDGMTCQRSPDHGSNHAASDGDGLVQW